MALSADKLRAIRGRINLAGDIVNSAVIFGGSFLALRGEDHATTADRGHMAVWTSGAGEIPLGATAEAGATGDTTVADPPETRGSVDGMTFHQEDVTGVASIADLGKIVYLSDDDVLTLTRPTVGMPAGMVSRFITGTTADVYLFSLGELLAIALGGSGQDMIYVGSLDLTNVNPNDAGGALVTIRTGIQLPYHGRIIDTYAIVDGVAIVGAGGAGDAYDLSLEIDGNDLTGGVVTINHADAEGAKVAGSAITNDDNNVFNEGSLLDVEVVDNATGSNITTGRVDLWIEVERLPGV